MHWTTNVQQCYEVILKTPQNENDVRLVHLLELQRIAETAKYILSGEVPQAKPRAANSSIGIHMKLLMAELQKFKSILPERFKQDRMSYIRDIYK